MPNTMIKSFVEKTNKSTVDVEKLWQRAKKIAAAEGQKDNYAYII